MPPILSHFTDTVFLSTLQSLKMSKDFVLEEPSGYPLLFWGSLCREHFGASMCTWWIACALVIQQMLRVRLVLLGCIRPSRHQTGMAKQEGSQVHPFVPCDQSGFY